MGLRSKALEAHKEIHRLENQRLERRRNKLAGEAKQLLAQRLGKDYGPRVKEVDLSRSLVTLEVEDVTFLVGRWDVYLGSLSRRLLGLADLGEYLETNADGHLDDLNEAREVGCSKVFR